MKRKYLDFTKIHIYRPTQSGSLPELRSRHNRGAYFKTGGKEEEEEEEDLIPTKDVDSEALIKKINTGVRKALQGRATKEEVAEIQKQLIFLTKGKNEKGEDVDTPFPIEALRSIADPKTGVLQKLIDMGLEVQKLKAAGERQIKDMSIRGQVEAWMESKPKELGGTRTVKEVIENIKNGHKENLPALEIRAAGTMHVSNVNAGSSPYIGKTEVEAGINPILRFENVFWNTLKKGRSGAPTHVWVNMVNDDGAAAFIGPGVAKPGIDFELAAETSTAKKIADSAKAGTELLQDIDGIVSFIEDELRAKVDIKINETLMTNSAGSSTVPAGIRFYAQDIAGSAFATAFNNIKTTTPNYMDAIRAAIAALRSGKLRGRITVYVNSVDMANMDMAKATDSGVYIIPPFVTSNGLTIAGAQVVEDPFMTVGSFLAAFTDYYRILIYKDFTVTWGWENDDFTKNLVTAVGELRMHQFVNSIFTGFAFYDQFQDVIDKITKA